MVICIQKHPNELYMVTTPPFINPMNVCPYINHDKESSSDCEANLCSH